MNEKPRDTQVREVFLFAAPFCIDYCPEAVGSVGSRATILALLIAFVTSLMYSAGPCDSLRQDLASFCYILLEFSTSL